MVCSGSPCACPTCNGSASGQDLAALALDWAVRGLRGRGVSSFWAAAGVADMFFRSGGDDGDQTIADHVNRMSRANAALSARTDAQYPAADTFQGGKAEKTEIEVSDPPEKPDKPARPGVPGGPTISTFRGWIVIDPSDPEWEWTRGHNITFDGPPPKDPPWRRTSSATKCCPTKWEYPVGHERGIRHHVLPLADGWYLSQFIFEMVAEFRMGGDGKGDGKEEGKDEGKNGDKEREEEQAGLRMHVLRVPSVGDVPEPKGRKTLSGIPGSLGQPHTGCRCLRREARSDSGAGARNADAQR